MASLLSRHAPTRFGAFYLAIAGLIVSVIGVGTSSAWWLAGVLAFGALTALGIYDIVQRRRTVSRNYPILAHIRYFLESIGPEFRQYFIESDTDEAPFSREQRSLVYRRAKSTSDKKPFGSLRDMSAPGYEWMGPSLSPVDITDHDFRIVVGEQRAHPYRASVINISAMSFGALSPNAISALNEGAREGGFYHTTGEGAISPYHLRGGDLVWQIGSGYFGCRREDGGFDPEKFRHNARRDEVKMIEIKLSQGAKPGHGGILPGAKVTAEIASTRGVPEGQDVLSPSRHSAFSTPCEMIHFIQQLRQLSGDKPVGIKLALGHPWEWFAIVKAMLECGDHPDYIVVDGGQGGTGAAPLEFINRLGMPLNDALVLVHNTLVGAGLRDDIRIAASGKLISAFDIARTLALGADWVNMARGFMFSLGCIQAQSCHNDQCPSGIATQDKARGSRLDVDDKAVRVKNFHANTKFALCEMLEAAGLYHPNELGPEHIIRRLDNGKALPYISLIDSLAPGELLRGGAKDHPLYREFWDLANANSFDAPDALQSLRQTKLL
ncbi:MULTISPECIES: FMN-binding glutamate synthase family protein [unclassified Halomonas]|uniref:FMN-binding glutamate synthase family protein n=1 Tax=unclassified Halomonas TaxID=2609666 RepID=UPI001C978216|nr:MULTISPECIES: FMN-binding glutamate synthase family protein [unclassified Halomonas]MBY5924118.1 FMN-binding glutamate synthase family protein [Halomonas sp. DP4Y7-2]MBY6231160.1 FMN-binding glutamate synthase family protein [Halomonas sp. DP4Y7-1]